MQNRAEHSDEASRIRFRRGMSPAATPSAPIGPM
jgi:hypothetical protein